MTLHFLAPFVPAGDRKAIAAAARADRGSVLNVRLMLVATLALAACSRDDSAARRARLGPNPTLAQRMQVADADAGAHRFGQCAACHSIAAGGADRNGPNLHGVYGAPVAQNRPRFGYTDALEAQQGVWDERRLDAWLADPRGTVPGTTMAFAGVRDPLDRADLIAYLKTQR